MLSYRHGFHAGNPADVLKHTLLIFCLEYLTRKEKPLLCVDTHAGAGSYPLHEGFAAQKREWESGVGTLLEHAAALDGGAGAMLRRYLELCAPAAPFEYPGSPLIMARLLRPADRLVCFELHPADLAACKSLLEGRAELRGRTEVRAADGFAGLKGLLPPPSGRGLILIDPPYELKDDYIRLPQALSQALKRFPSGTYLVWYPLLRQMPEAIRGMDVPARLMELYPGNRCRVELHTASPGAASGPHSPRGMYGSGLVIYNPPWTLKAALAESLPLLGKLIGNGTTNSEYRQE
jgi:23S rRNA (adenine2030-N6)-methyltransferase